MGEEGTVRWFEKCKVVYTESWQYMGHAFVATAFVC